MHWGRGGRGVVESSRLAIGGSMYVLMTIKGAIAYCHPPLPVHTLYALTPNSAASHG